MDYDPTAPKTETLTVDILRMGAMTRQSRNVIASSNLTAELMADDIMGGLLYQLEAKMLSRQWKETGVDQSYIFVPATWWDHLKQDLCARFPWMRSEVFTKINTRRITVQSFNKTYNVCPHVDLMGKRSKCYDFLAYGPQPTSFQGIDWGDPRGDRSARSWYKPPKISPDSPPAAVGTQSDVLVGKCEVCWRPDARLRKVYWRGLYENQCENCQRENGFI